MKRLLAAWMLLVQLALCWTIGLAEDAFEKADDANHFLPHFLTEIECLAGGQTER